MDTDDAHCTYVLMGIENQSSIHYALPVKNLLYDALNYERQWSEISKKHRKSHDLSKDEFISGSARTDRLKPVITLTIYWSSKKWDGPRTLHQMPDIPDARMKNFINVCTNENFEINEKGGVTNMCRGMDIIRAESRNEGIIEAILDLLSDMGEIPVNLKENIQSQQDHDTLKRWHKLAARCDSLGDFMNQM